jgi:hypothetical protein
MEGEVALVDEVDDVVEAISSEESEEGVETTISFSESS